jgi:hypothetical protein
VGVCNITVSKPTSRQGGRVTTRDCSAGAPQRVADRGRPVAALTLLGYWVTVLTVLGWT